MKRIRVLIGVLLILLAVCAVPSIAESNGELSNGYLDEELPEGVYLYTPANNRFLPWTQVDGNNVFQIIGLAPHDSVVSLKIKAGDETVWTGETMAEANGYFYAEVPGEVLNIEPQYVLEAASGYFSAQSMFFAYLGTVGEFASDPVHLAFLADMTAVEKYVYDLEMKNEDTDDEENSVEELLVGEIIQTGPNEYRNDEFSYIINEDGTATLTHYYKHAENLKIPTTVDGYQVSLVEFPIFSKATGVKTVTIPSSVGCNNLNPFCNWTSLTAIYVPQDHPTLASVNGTLYSRDLKQLIAQPQRHPEKELEIPNGTRVLNQSAFFCSTVRKVILPESLREVGAECFAYARYMRHIELSDGIRVLRMGCLRDSGLTSLMIPSNAAATACFTSNCKSLKEITVMPGNETMQSIDGVLFSADGETLISYPAGREDKKYTTPKGTVTIGMRAFSGTVNLQKAELSETVTEIQQWGFEKSSIQSVRIPNSLTEISPINPFFECKNLKEFQINSNHPTLSAVKRKYLYSKDHTIFYCYPLGAGDTSYTLEKETKIIEGNAFAYAELNSVILPEGLEEIGYAAFFGSNVSTIYVPGSVKRIGQQAFSYAYLKYIALESGVEVLTDHVFTGSSLLSGVSVPETVKSIGELCFLDTGEVRIFTPEGSYMHQYALQNKLNLDVEPGQYEAFTESVRKNRDPLRATGYITTQEIEITSKEKANIRQKPDLESRRLGIAELGETYTVLDMVYDGEKVTWYKVELKDGTEGYINAKVATLL